MQSSLLKLAFIVFGIILGGYALATAIQLLTGKPPEVSTLKPVSTAPPTGVTMDNYMRVQTGMSYTEVVQILGKHGTESSRGDVAGFQTVLYTWQADGVGSMNAMFQNGKLIQKAQFGLK